MKEITSKDILDASAKAIENEQVCSSVLKVGTSWCPNDIRNHFGNDVNHMTNEEIQDGIDNLEEKFNEMCIQSGWDVINYNFSIKEKDNEWQST